MRRLINYWFKPFECQYESNWSHQCYNRLWYALCILVNPLTFSIIAGVSIYYDLYLPLIAFFCIFVFNMIQLAFATKKYISHCEDLYNNLIYRGENNE